MTHDSTATPPEQNLDELRRDYDRTKKLAEEYLNGWKRAKADYLNLKREVDKEKAELIAMANAGLLLDLLPVYSHLKLAMTHVPAEAREKDWVKGFQQIHRQFQELLKRLGVEEVKTVGEPFDPKMHEAVGSRKVEGAKPHTVVEEVQPGYLLASRVIQPAKVKVAE